jgi:hypothetical protein
MPCFVQYTPVFCIRTSVSVASDISGSKCFKTKENLFNLPTDYMYVFRVISEEKAIIPEISINQFSLLVDAM